MISDVSTSPRIKSQELGSMYDFPSSFRCSTTIRILSSSFVTRVPHTKRATSSVFVFTLLAKGHGPNANTTLYMMHC